MSHDANGLHNTPAGIVALGGFIVSLGTHIYSFATAPGDARAYNAERHPLAALSTTFNQQHGRVEVGFAIAVR